MCVYFLFFYNIVLVFLRWWIRASCRSLATRVASWTQSLCSTWRLSSLKSSTIASTLREKKFVLRFFIYFFVECYYYFFYNERKVSIGGRDVYTWQALCDALADIAQVATLIIFIFMFCRHCECWILLYYCCFKHLENKSIFSKFESKL